MLAICGWGRHDGLDVPCANRESRPSMLRTVNPQPTLWEAVIPECLLPLPGDLGRVDGWLDDPRFFEPFRAFFDPTLVGRRSRWRRTCG